MTLSAPVWLVGMMGAGKSSVGKALALRLGRGFVDTDAEVERAAGRSIGEIFAAEGEAAFRVHERAAVTRCLGQPAVVALGGGAIADVETARLVSQAGEIVYLRTRAETLLARVGDAQARPLLAGHSEPERLRRLRELLLAREPAYLRATLCIETDERTLDEVVDAIVAGLGGLHESS